MLKIPSNVLEENAQALRNVLHATIETYCEDWPCTERGILDALVTMLVYRLGCEPEMSHSELRGLALGYTKGIMAAVPEVRIIPIRRDGDA